MSEKLITAAAMQKQAERIRAYLDSGSEWKLEGNTVSVGFKYKNAGNSNLMLKGIKSIDGLEVAEQSITVNSSAYDSDTQVTISGEGYDFTLADTASVMINSPNTNLTAGAANSSVYLTAGAANSSVCLTAGAANSSVYSDGNCYIDNAASYTKIIGNVGNDTILNTGGKVSITTGKDGSSSISDYSPYVSDSYGTSINAQGNADTIYIDENRCYVDTKNLPSNNAAPVLFFGDKASVNNQFGGSYIDRFYIARAKNIKFSSGSGADTITVGANVENITIAGGGGADYISIASGNRTTGNFYSVSSGQGNDTIEGWDPDKDTLIINAANIASSLMSSDGKDLIFEYTNEEGKSKGSVRLKDIGATNPTDKTIKVKVGNAAVSNFVVPYAMHGTTKGETITNTTYEGSASKAFTIDGGAGNDTISNSKDYVSIVGGAGNDTIINEGSYVYIDGGAGKDQIIIQAKGTAMGLPMSVTEGVTINGGASIDSADVSQDTILSNAEVIHGAHIFEYNPATNDYYVITGFTGNDTIKLTGDYDVDYIKANSSVTGNSTVEDTCEYVIRFASTNRISLKGVECEMPINLVDSVGAVVIPNFKVPKEIAGTSGSNTFVVTGGENGTYDYSGYVVNALEGNDSVTVSAHSVSINGGAGNDRIVLLGGTNVDKDTLSPNYGKVIAEKAVTVYGYTSNDSIFADEDYYASSGTTVYASHVYQFGVGEGKDSIFGYNENDTIQILDSEATVSAITTGSSISGGYTFNITKDTATTTLHLKAIEGYMANKRINLYRLNASGTFDSIGFENGVGYKTLEGGAERVTVEGETSDYYRLPKIIQGTSSADNFYVDSKYSGYTVNAPLGENDTIVFDGANSVYVDSNHSYNYITVTGRAKDCTVSCNKEGSTYIDNASGIYADSSYVTVTSGANNCSINGVYILIDNASGIYVVDGYEVTVTSGANNCTVANGSNGSGKIDVYNKNASGNIYSVSGGKRDFFVWGYKAEDTILIDGTSYTHSVGTSYTHPVSSGFNIIYYEGNTAPKIYLTGALKEGAVFGSDYFKDYDSLEGGTKLNISVKSGDAYVDSSTFVPRLIVGKAEYNYDEEFNVTVSEHTVNAFGGNDSVTVSGSNSSINAGSGDDVIRIESPATNCTIFGGDGNDSIYNNSNGNIFYYLGSTGEGTDSLSAFNSDDLFYINDSDCTVSDSIVSGNARLQITKGTVNTYVLIIGKTTGDTVRIKLGAEGAIQTYTIGTGFSS